MGKWGAGWASLLASFQIGGSGLATASAALVLATLVYWPPPTGWLRRGAVHVAPDGFDGSLGPSRRFAVRTIQRAADLAEPGETILIWPGTYREEVFLRRGGSPGRPLVLRGCHPGPGGDQRGSGPHAHGLLALAGSGGAPLEHPRESRRCRPPLGWGDGLPQWFRRPPATDLFQARGLASLQLQRRGALAVPAAG